MSIKDDLMKKLRGLEIKGNKDLIFNNRILDLIINEEVFITIPIRIRKLHW